MNGLLFAKRNIKNFFRDKTAVFFSLLSAIIIIGLYVLFLGNMLIQDLQAQNIQNARFIMDSWIMAGVISVTSITTAMGAFEAVVRDKETKIIKDFNAAPIKKSQMITGYVLSTAFIGFIMTMVSLVFAEIYILAYGGSLLSFIQYIKIIGIIILSVTSNTLMLLFVISFIKSNTVFATASTILGTLIGFLAGVYMPIGVMPKAIGYVIKILPVSHSAVLLRQIMMGDAITAAFGQGEFLTEFSLDMGIQFEVGGTILPPVASILYIVFAGILFFILSLIRISKKSV